MSAKDMGAADPNEVRRYPSGPRAGQGRPTVPEEARWDAAATGSERRDWT